MQIHKGHFVRMYEIINLLPHIEYVFPRLSCLFNRNECRLNEHTITSIIQSANSIDYYLNIDGTAFAYFPNILIHDLPQIRPITA